MAQMTVTSLLSSVFLVCICCVLIIVGVLNIRSGARDRARTAASEHALVWHKQPLILFGTNNLLFALLLFWAACLIIVSSPTVRYVLIGLIIGTLILSILLIIRMVTYASQASRRLREQRTTRRS